MQKKQQVLVPQEQKPTEFSPTPQEKKSTIVSDIEKALAKAKKAQVYWTCGNRWLKYGGNGRCVCNDRKVHLSKPAVSRPKRCTKDGNPLPNERFLG